MTTPRRILAPHKITPAGLTLLLLLLKNGPMTCKDLASQSGYDQPYVSRLSTRLEAGGWITRTRDPKEFRSKIAHLAVAPEKVRELAAQIETPAPAA